MLIGVLGTLIARGDDGRVAAVRGPARRQLLAALVIRVGRPVPAATLIDDLWGDAPPESAPKTLQSHMVRLRHDLAPVADGVGLIVTDGSTYRLAVSALAIDAGCFERDVERGTEALAANDPEAAAGHLDSALAWWRGEAYAEFTDVPFAEAERLRLSELHSFAHERRIEAGLRLGRGASLVGDIESRLAIDPYRERLWEHLLVALYRADRQADALAAYRRARTLLADDLGVEPGPELRRIQQLVLAQADSLRAGDGRRDVVRQSVIAQGEPAPIRPYLGLAGYEETDSALFVAREHVTARLLDRLRAARLLVVTGHSGAGKSSVVRAGLLPAIRTGGLPGSAAWTCTVIRPSQLRKAAADGDVGLLVVDQAEELFTLDEADVSASEVDDLLTVMLDRGVHIVLVVRADFYGRLGELSRLADRVGPATELVTPMTEDELRRVIVEPARRVGLDVEPELVTEAIADVRGQAGALPLLSAALLRTWQKRQGAMLTVAAYRAGGGVREALEATAEDAYLSLSEPGRLETRRLLVRLATRQRGIWSRRPMHQDGDAIALVAPPTLRALTVGRIVTITADHIELVHEALLEHWPRLRAWLDERSAIADLVEWLGNAAHTWESGGRDDSDLVRGPRLQAALEWRAENRDDMTPLERQFIDRSNVAAQGELLAARQRADREARGRRRLRYVVAALAAVTVVAFGGVIIATRARAAQQQAALSADARRIAALSLTAPDLRTSLLLSAAAYRLQPSEDTRGALLSAIQRGGTALWSIAMPARALFADADNANDTLWTMDPSRTVYRYDLATQRLATTFSIHADVIAGLAPDGRQLAVVGQNHYFDTEGTGRITVLNAADGSAIDTLPVTTVDSGASPNPAVFTGDGRWLAVVEAAPATPTIPAGLTPSSVLAVFDATDYHRPPRLLRLDAPIIQLAAGQTAFAIVTASGTITVAAAANFAVIERGRRSELARRNPADDTQFWWRLSAGAQQIALTEPGDATQPYLLDTHDLGGPLRSLERLDTDIASMSFSRTGRLIAISAESGSVDVFHTADARLAMHPLDAAVGQASHLAWSGTGAEDLGLYAAGRDARILALDLQTGPRLARTQGASIGGLQGQMLAGHKVIAFGTPAPGSSGSLIPFRITDLATGTSTTTDIAVDPAETVVYLSADDAGRRLLLDTQGPDQIIRSNLYDLASGRLLNRFTPDGVPSEHNTDDGVIAPDGRTAVYAIAPHTLATLSLPDGRRLNRYDVNFTGPAADRHWITPGGFSPDGRRLLVAGFDILPSEVRSGKVDPNAPGIAPESQLAGIVDLRTRHLDGQVGGFGSEALAAAAAWSPDGSKLALGTSAGTMRVVSARNLAPISSTVQAAVGNLTSLSFSPDGNTIVSGGDGGELAFWDGQSLRPIGPPIRSVVPYQWWAWYRSDGSIAGYAPGDTGGTERWFDMPAKPDQWLASACQLAGTTLSKSEWDRYIGAARRYQDPC